MSLPRGESDVEFTSENFGKKPEHDKIRNLRGERGNKSRPPPFTSSLLTSIELEFRLSRKFRRYQTGKFRKAEFDPEIQGR